MKAPIIQFKGNRFYFGNGHTFPGGPGQLTPAQQQDLDETGEHVAAMFEFHARFVPGFLGMISRIDNPAVAAQMHKLVETWKDEARKERQTNITL